MLSAALMQADRRLALLMAICVYASLAASLAPQAYATVLLHYAYQTLVLPFGLVVGLGIGGMLVSPAAPASWGWQVVRRNGMRLLAVTLAFCIGFSAFTTFKLQIPRFVPFYADPLFADADAWLHGGDPGLILHRIVPHWLQLPIFHLYGPVWLTQWMGAMVFVALHDDAALRRRYFWSMAISFCALGTMLATLLSSVGPVFYSSFYESDRFAALALEIRSSAFGGYMEMVTDYLLSTYQEGSSRLGTGISAMPSMHLAVVTLNALMISSLSRRLGIFAWAYVAIILLGSVYLGWHYAVDGYVSIAAVGAIWWSVGRFRTAYLTRMLDSRAASEKESSASASGLRPS